MRPQSWSGNASLSPSTLSVYPSLPFLRLRGDVSLVKVGSDHPKSVLVPSSGHALVGSETYIRAPVKSKKSHYDLEGEEEFSEILTTSKALGDHGKERKGSAKEHASCSAYSDSGGACGAGEKTLLH